MPDPLTDEFIERRAGHVDLNTTFNRIMLVMLFGLGGNATLQGFDIFNQSTGEITRGDITSLNVAIQDGTQEVIDDLSPKIEANAKAIEQAENRLDDIMDQVNEIEIDRAVVQKQRRLEDIESRIEELALEMIRVRENGNLTDALQGVYQAQIERLTAEKMQIEAAIALMR